MPRPTILFVSYGGGHIRALLPVIKALLAGGAFDVQVLGLTTARAVVEAEGIPAFGIQGFLAPDDARARAWGERLAGSQGSALVDPAESVAYLGLSYVELEDQLGVEEAAAAFAQRGRGAFYPVRTMGRVLDRLAPAVVVTTSSPRAESAVVAAARQRGIPAVCVSDLFAIEEVTYMGAPGYADRICVLDEHVRERFLRAGRKPEEIVVTGNPAFDSLATAGPGPAPQAPLPRPDSLTPPPSTGGGGRRPGVGGDQQPSPPTHPTQPGAPPVEGGATDSPGAPPVQGGAVESLAGPGPRAALEAVLGGEGRPWVLYVSQPEPALHRLTGEQGDPRLPFKVLAQVAAIAARRPDLHFLVRPHPSQDPAEFQGIPGVTPAGQEVNLHALLRAVDVLVCLTSTVGYEAALLGKPMLHLPLSVYNNEADYSEMGLGLRVPRLEDLEAGLDRVLAGEGRPTMALPPVGTATDAVVRVIHDLLP